MEVLDWEQRFEKTVSFAIEKEKEVAELYENLSGHTSGANIASLTS